MRHFIVYTLSRDAGGNLLARQFRYSSNNFPTQMMLSARVMGRSGDPNRVITGVTEVTQQEIEPYWEGIPLLNPADNLLQE